MRKNFLSRLKPFSERLPPNPKVELKMLPRLKAVGFILILFGFASFFYAYFAPKEERLLLNIDSLKQEPYAGVALVLDESPFDLSPTEVLNFYIVGALFLSAGNTILFVVRKKRRHYSALVSHE